MRELSRISDDEINKIADKMSDYFLKDIRKNSFSIDFNILEKRLETKYMHDGHSAMFLNGRKGVRIIVDHGMSEQWSEICLLYTSPSPRDRTRSRMPSSA